MLYIYRKTYDGNTASRTFGKTNSLSTAYKPQNVIPTLKAAGKTNEANV